MNPKNPKLQFYKLMYQLLTAPEFINMVASEVIRLRRDYSDVLTIGEFSRLDLLVEHMNQHEQQHPDTTTFVSGLLLALAHDLFPQLRNKEVQDLVAKYRWFKTHDTVLVANARRIKLMGDGGAATVTLVVNDWRLFLIAMSESVPEDAWRGIEEEEGGKELDFTLMSYEKPS